MGEMKQWSVTLDSNHPFSYYKATLCNISGAQWYYYVLLLQESNSLALISYDEGEKSWERSLFCLYWLVLWSSALPLCAAQEQNETNEYSSLLWALVKSEKGLVLDRPGSSLPKWLSVLCLCSIDFNTAMCLLFLMVTSCGNGILCLLWFHLLGSS